VVNMFGARMDKSIHDGLLLLIPRVYSHDNRTADRTFVNDLGGREERDKSMR